MHDQHTHGHDHESDPEPTPTLDPVCGMVVDPDTTLHHAVHDGQEFHFCGAGCKARFEADPAAFGDEAPPPADVAAGTEYTCPMHPEIRQIGPGTCPICGMALEPVLITAEPEDDGELRDMTRRLVVSAAFTLPVFVIAMGDLIPGRPLQAVASPAAYAWIELALATPVIFYGAWPFFVRGVQSLVNRSLNMFTLISLGVAVAYGYSVVAVLLPDVFPPAFREHGVVARYFEAAAVITTLVLVGQVMELRARSQTGAAIRALLGLAPKTARRVEDDGTEGDVPLDQVQLGDKLRVRPGEKVTRRRRRARGHQQHRRIDGHRRGLAGDQAGRRSGDRRNGERNGRVGDPRRESGCRHPARPYRADGGRGTAQPSADPEASRPGGGCVRSRRHPDRHRDLRDLGRWSGPSRD